MNARHEVMWLFHGTAMVEDYVRARDWLIRFTGCRVLQDDENDNPGVARRGGMTWIGDNSLELGQPTIPGTAPWRFLERFGPGMHSIALQVVDIEATIAYLAARGIAVGARPSPNFIFTDPRATDGILLEWFAGAQKDDPRFGAPMPPFAVPPLLPVERHAWLGALVTEPRRAAEHFAALFGTEVTFEDAAAGPDRPEAGVSTRDCTIAFFRLPEPETARALWGIPYARPRAHLMALSVPDLAAAGAVLYREGIDLVRREAELLLPRPEQTGYVPVAFTDRLLPNDPRLAAAAPGSTGGG